MKNDHFAKQLLTLLDKASPLDLAHRAQDDSSKVGFDFTHIDQVIGKVKEEFNEMLDAYSKRDSNMDHLLEEIGDCFFSLVNLCRFLDKHPDDVVRTNVEKYLNRCIYIENQLEASQSNWVSLNADSVNVLWKQAKMYNKG